MRGRLLLLILPQLCLFPNAAFAGLLRRAGALGRQQVQATDWAQVLGDAGDKLGGIADAMVTGLQDVRGKVIAVESACQKRVTAAAQLTQEETRVAQELDTTRLQHAHTKASIEAELTHLAEEETKAQASFDSAVQRRAKNHQAYVDWTGTSGQQLSAISQVLARLEQIRAQIQAASTTGGGASQELSQIIGVFTQMKDSVSADLAKEAAHQPIADKELLDLVASYKQTLQDVEDQYATKVVEKVSAEVGVLQAKEEANLRSELASAEARTMARLQELCGSGGVSAGIGAEGKSGLVLAEGDRRLQTLQTDVEQALTQLRTLGYYDSAASGASGGAALVERHRRLRPRQQRSPAGIAPLPRAGPLQDEVRRRPATLAAVQRRTAWAGAVGHLQGGGGGDAAAVAGATRSRHLLAASSPNASAAELSREGEQCVNLKQTLTHSLLEARRKARVTRADLISAQGRSSALGGWVALAQSRKQGVDTTVSELTTAGTPLATALDAGSSFRTDLTDAATEMSGVEADIESFAADVAAPPLAQSLKATVVNAARALQEVQNYVTGSPGDMQTLVELQSALGDVQITAGAVSTQFGKKADDLRMFKGAVDGALTSLQGDVQSAEAQATGFETQLSQADELCEQGFYAVTAAPGAPSGTTAAPSPITFVGAARGAPGVSADQAAKAWAAARTLLGGSIGV